MIEIYHEIRNEAQSKFDYFQVESLIVFNELLY